MFTGLAEAHLGVSNLDDSIVFYERFGLSQDGQPENHVAFEVSYDDMLDAQTWLADHSIEKRAAQGADHNPFVRPHQGNASLYFEDPDGNSLEFLAWLPEGVDEDREAKLGLAEYEAERTEGGPR